MRVVLAMIDVLGKMK